MASRKARAPRNAVRSANRRATPARPHAGPPADPPVATPQPAPPPATTDDLLDMDQAIALLKTTRPTFYRWLRAGQLTGMKVGRQWRFDRSEIERFLRGDEPRIELRADIEPLLDALRDRLGQLDTADPFGPETPPLDRALMLLMLMMVNLGATDLHIEPQETRERRLEALLRCRVDGMLHTITTFDARLLGPLLDRCKTIASVDVREKHKPQFAVLAIRLPGIADTPVLRATFLPAQLGESLTIRMTGTTAQAAPALDLDKLGLAAGDRQRLDKALAAPYGLILVSGPAAVGKTTTLYSCLSHIATPDRKIVTVEDPVQHVLPGVTQAQVRTDAGATDIALLRAALLSAPNAVLLSEIRGAELLHLLLDGALTGHLMFSTVHCDDAATALHRLVELGADPQVVIDAVRLVIAQRLVRTLCPHCSRPDASPPFIDRAMDLAHRGGLAWDSLPRQFRAPGGCARCNHVGYAGRTIVAETLEIGGDIPALLRQGASPAQLRTAAVRNGMTTFAADALRKAAEGLTSLDEAVRLAGAGPARDRDVTSNSSTASA